MEIIFASFQGFSKNGTAIGMVRIISSMLTFFNVRYKYYVSSKPDNHDDSNAYVVSDYLSLFFKIINKSNKIIRKYGVEINYGKVRLLQEVLYDYFLSFRIKKGVILVSTAYAPFSFNKNKKMGGKNIFIAGNAYDRSIKSALELYAKPYGVEVKDAYTYAPRLDFIDKHIDFSDHIICNTQVVYESYVSYFPNKTIELCECHVDVGHYMSSGEGERKSPKLTFCYIAHTVWLKGLIYLIEAFNLIDNDDIKLVIGGPIDEKTQQKINELKINDNIVFSGMVSNVSTFMNQYDVCIVPSLIDNHPATISEALYSGLPVITTEGCGSKTLIEDGVNGFVIPIADSEEIRRKIIWFIDNKDQLESMSKMAKESVGKVEIANQSQRLSMCIQNAINKIDE